MFEKLQQVEDRFNFIEKELAKKEVVENNKMFVQITKEYSEIQDTVLKFREYKKKQEELVQSQELLNDPEFKDIAYEEVKELKEQLVKIAEELKQLLVPKDENDDKNIICEIRAGAGGDEAALFAGVLFRMYSMYAEKKHWTIEVLNENETGLRWI